VGGFVEAELPLDLRQEVGVDAARKLVAAACARVRIDGTAGAADGLGDGHAFAGDAGDCLVHGTAGRDLHNDEVDQHDADQGRKDEQDSAGDVGIGKPAEQGPKRGRIPASGKVS